MLQTTVTILRQSGTSRIPYVDPQGRTASGIAVQVDQASDQEMNEHYQVIPDSRGKLLYKVYTLSWNANALILIADILLDERYIDPDGNGAYFRYRLIGRPKNYWYDHQECYCETTIGT